MESDNEFPIVPGVENWHLLVSVDTSGNVTTLDPTVAVPISTKSEDDEDRRPIQSRLVGSFSGWDGQTVFKLENGMIWAQSDKDKFYTKEMMNPEVEIKPGMFGTWRLNIVGFGSECRVKRIQ